MARIVQERTRTLPSELRRGSHGVWAWLLQRVSALLLLVLLPLKIWSGYVFTGRAPGPPGVAALHADPLVDSLLLVSLSFHVLLGLRVMLIDAGLAGRGRALFSAAIAVAAVLSLVALGLLLGS